MRYIALFLFMPALVNAQHFSYVDEKCVRDGVYVCIDHPALNASKPVKKKPTIIINKKAKPVATGKQRNTSDSCKGLTWKLTGIDNEFGIYESSFRGKVAPGVSLVYTDLYDQHELVGTGVTIPHPGGTWVSTIYSDIPAKRSFKPKFYCQ